MAAIVSVQVGAAFAKDLFGAASPAQVVWLRLAVSAGVLMALARPSVRGRSAQQWRIVAAFASSLAVMNWAIYESFSRIPLGAAVTIEFLGPLAVSIVGSRRARDLVWVALAATGVALLSGGAGGLETHGVALALVAASAWAAYILLSKRTGQAWPGLDGLAVASLMCAVVLAPVAWSGDVGPLTTPRVLAIAAVVGLLSSVIPYSLEMAALRRLRPAPFAILMSLEPAVAALAAMVVLREFLGPVQWLAMGCVVAASVGATRSAPLHREPAPDGPR